MIDEQEFLRVVNKMKDHTFPSLSAIYGTIDKDNGELVGTGTFIAFQSQPYLLTAGHVAKKSSKYIGLAHSCSDGFSPAYITNPYYILNTYLDICIVKIQEEKLKGTKISPTDINILARNSNNLDKDILFIHGYPGERSKPIKLLNAVFSQTLPYGTTIGVSEYPWFNNKYHFALEYPLTGQKDENLNSVQLDEPYGLSGSAVWKTNRNNFDKNWSPLKAEIVGIIHHWDNKTHCLVATRIEVIREFLLKTFRREFAYFRWLKRGAIINDDWNDWFAACNAIPDITNH